MQQNRVLTITGDRANSIIYYSASNCESHPYNMYIFYLKKSHRIK